MTRRKGEISDPAFNISDRTIRPAGREGARPQEYQGEARCCEGLIGVTAHVFLDSLP
jgi:hypothetical protein